VYSPTAFSIIHRHEIKMVGEYTHPTQVKPYSSSLPPSRTPGSARASRGGYTRKPHNIRERVGGRLEIVSRTTERNGTNPSRLSRR
jgi:hypothetical protein